MKIKFKCTMRDNSTRYRIVDVELGAFYRCKKEYSDDFTSDYPIFEEDTWYELVLVDELSATFKYKPRNGGEGHYFLKTYVNDCLFEHFDLYRPYDKYLQEQRVKKLEELNV